MSMEKEFVPYQEALELKELEFDEECFGYYDLDGLQIRRHHWYPQNKNSSFPLPHTTNNPKISAPTFSQAFRWFRENHGLNYEIPYAGKDGEYHAFVKDYIYGNNRNSPSVFTYEEAELACLVKLIEIVKEQKS